MKRLLWAIFVIGVASLASFLGMLALSMPGHRIEIPFGVVKWSMIIGIIFITAGSFVFAKSKEQRGFEVKLTDRNSVTAKKENDHG